MFGAPRRIARSILKPSSLNFRGFGAAAEGELKKTAMFALHNEMGGKMVPFAGYELPVQFEQYGVLKEHLHTREKGCASLFDVSHMGQIKWEGKDTIKFLEKMVVGDIASLKPGEAKLSLIMNESGGIVDDTVITMGDDYVYMVVNGACKDKDITHFLKYMSDFEVTMHHLQSLQLIALQGDGAKDVVARLCPQVDLPKMPFMTAVADVTIAGIPHCRLTRCGYTGEDGFEISVPEANAVKLAKTLYAEPEVRPAGLGARDSLRLEAGLCLYGHDLNEDISPVEGALTWTIGGPKSRRRTEQGFLGASKFLKPDGKLLPVSKKRVGITGMKAPAREHTELFNAEGTLKIGEITSGGFSPTLKKPIAMGYVNKDFADNGTTIAVSLRGKMMPAQISPMPFVESNYYKPE